MPPPAVPALPDSERRTAYSLSGGTGPLAVNFAIYGDGTDYWDWVEVWLNQIRVDYNDAARGWSLTSPSGPIGSIARPITDAVINFNAAQSGPVQIIGARRPRRVAQYNENAGIPARDENQNLTDMVAMQRESWDFAHARVLSVPGGETLSTIPNANLRKNLLLGFDGSGNPNLVTPTAFGAVSAGQPIIGGTNNTLLYDNTGSVGFATVGAGLSLSGGVLTAPASGPGVSQGVTVTPIVNVLGFGAVGDGVHDDTSAIQAAIDYAFANHIVTIYVPSGFYLTSLPLWLDLPGGMRGTGLSAWSSGTTYALNAVVTYLGQPWISLSGSNVNNTPSMASTFWQISPQAAGNTGFSFNFYGDQGMGSGDNNGTMILPNFNNGTAIYVGPVQAGRIASITLSGPPNRVSNGSWPNYRQTQDYRGAGILTAAHGNGSERFLIERCLINNFYTGIGIGQAGPQAGLGADNKLIYNTILNCAYCVLINFNQAYTNGLIDNGMQGNVLVATLQGTGANIWGGNLSPGQSYGTELQCSSFTNRTSAHAQENYYTWQCTLSAPTWIGNVSVTGASGTGTNATVTFAAMPQPFPIGSTVFVQGIVPAGYNPGGSPGGVTVISSTTTSFTYANTTVAPYVSGGTLTQIYGGPFNQDNSPTTVSFGGKLWFAAGGSGAITPTLGQSPWIELSLLVNFQSGDGTPIVHSVFNDWFFPTANYGVVPAQITGYDANTHIASFSTRANYGGKTPNLFYPGTTSFDLIPVTDTGPFSTDLGNTTTCWAAEIPVLMWGSPIQCYASFLEETQGGPTRLIDTTIYFHGPIPSTIDGMYLDSSPDCYLLAPDYSGASGGIIYPNSTYFRSEYAAAQIAPSVVSSQGPLEIRNVNFQTNSNLRMIASAALKLTGCTSGSSMIINGSSTPSSGPWPDLDIGIPNPSVISSDNYFNVPITMVSNSRFSGFAYLGTGKSRGDQIDTTGGVPYLSLDHTQALLGPLPTLTPSGSGQNVTWSYSGAAALPCLCGGVDYPVMRSIASSNPANPNFGQKVFVVPGIVGPGNVTVTGATVGDAVLWATNLTTPADVTSNFARSITSNNNVAQTGTLTGQIQIAIQTPQFISSNHQGFSYGFNLTTTNVPNLKWRYIGGSLTVYCNLELIFLIFPGLYVAFNNGSGVGAYRMVVDVYPHYSYSQGGSLPWFVLAPVRGSSSGLEGTAGTVYTSTGSPHGETAIIYQQPYVLNVS
jgi:hypothetical protein